MSLECKAGELSTRGSQLKVGQQVSILFAWSHAWQDLWMIRLIGLLEPDSMLLLYSLDFVFLQLTDDNNKAHFCIMKLCCQSSCGVWELFCSGVRCWIYKLHSAFQKANTSEKIL